MLFVGARLFSQELRTSGDNTYKVHLVEKGHTLFAISKTYSISVDEILDANPSAKSGLQIGQELLIPIEQVDKKAAKSNPPEMKGKYLKHTVEKKETLYSISKKYNIDVNSLIEYNPEAQMGLQPGQVLKIYVGDIEVDTPELIAPAKEDSLINHKVLAGETLYAISKQYDVPIDSILRINNGLPDGVQAGTYLRIPKYTEEYKAIRDLEEKERWSSTMLEGSRLSYNIALMLPFSTEIQDSIFKHSDPTKPTELYALTDISVEIYRGVLIALDSLKKMGFSAELFVYDVAEDIESAMSVIHKPELNNMHLIIGPLHRSSYEVVAEFGSKKGISVVSPVPNQMLKTSHPTSVTIHPKVDEQMRYLGRYMAKMHFTDKVIVVNSNKLKDSDYVKTFLSAYNSNYKFGDTLTTVTVGKFGLENLTNRLSTTQKNYVVVPSSDVAFVSDFMNRLSNVQSSKYNITVVGMEKWLDYDNIDFQYKERFNLLLPSTAFLDFESEESQEFIKKHRKLYDSDPGQEGYAFLGFDVAWYFMSGLHQYGLDYTKHYAENKYEGLNVSFNFEQGNYGCQNRFIYILQQKNYELKRIN